MDQKVSKVAGVSKNLILLVLLFSISACSLLKRESNTSENPEVIAPAKSENTSMTVYYPKKDASGIAKVVIKVEVPKNSNQTFNQMMAAFSNPSDENVLAIFPEKTDLYGTFVDKDILYLDFSSTIQKAVFPTIQVEQLALEAFLTTIKANFPNVGQVKFLADHEDTQVVFGHTYAQQPFSLKDL